MKKFCSLFLLTALLFSPLSHAEKEIRVYVDMVADLFHFGHVNFLKQAKACGTYLIVGLTSDEDVARYKRYPIMNVEERAESVRGCKYVDEVIPNSPYCVTEEFIKEHNIDLVIHGDDMSQEMLNFFYNVPIRLGIFQTVPYTSGISTSELIRRIQGRISE